VPEVERILIVDFTSTHARAKGVAPSASREGGQTKATAAFTSKCLTSTHYQRGGLVVLPTGRDPCHRRRATSGVHLLGPI
jgi:hypothetical protein